MTTRWNVDCWNCGGSGEQEGDCTCMDDTCCCAEPTPPSCHVCKGKGFFEVTRLTDDNYDTAVPID